MGILSFLQRIPFRAQCVGWCHPHSGSSLLGISFWNWPYRHTRDLPVLQEHLVQWCWAVMHSDGIPHSISLCKQGQFYYSRCTLHNTTQLGSYQAVWRSESWTRKQQEEWQGFQMWTACLCSMKPARVVLHSLYLFVFYNPAMCWTLT